MMREKGKVTINDTELGFFLLGEDKKKPVLLVCGGGPGIPEYLLEDLYPSVLSKHFIVCYFEYRGTGLSFDKDVDPKKMTTELYLSDIDGMTEYLRHRFQTEKIYIMGHSFGTYMALNTVYRHPEKYTAYLAVSQNTNQQESEYRAYDYMIEQYTKRHNSKMVSKFKEYPIYDSKEAFNEYCTSGLRDKAMHELGVGTARDMHSVVSELFFPSLRCKAYTMGERINIWRGKVKANHFAVTDDAFHFNAFKNIEKLEIPVYFFAGRHDYTCCESLQEEYYQKLNAPEKRYYLYPDAAHSPVFEDAEQTDKYLKEIIGNK